MSAQEQLSKLLLQSNQLPFARLAWYQLVALGLSVAVHLGLGSVVGISTRSNSGLGVSQKNVASYLSVSLVHPERESDSTLGSRSKVDGPAEKAPSMPVRESAPVQERDNLPPSENEPLLAVSWHLKPHYFLVSELNERPLVSEDHASTLSLYLPGISPQIARMRLFINEYGDVDRVELEKSELPEEAERLITEAFSRTKFHAGKIDGVSVKTQIKIEVAVEDLSSQNDPQKDNNSGISQPH